MDIQQIKYFLALADELHFWRTSEKMFITQSALSRHIQALEQELGLKLFLRDNRNVKLTKAGEFLRGEYAKLLTEFDSVARHARQIDAGEFGTLRIGHPASITFSVLPDLVAKMSARHTAPVIQMVELDFGDFDAALANYHIDIGFNREPPHLKGLASRKMMTENFALAVPADHPLARKRKIDPSKLKDEWFVLPGFTGESDHIEQVRAFFKAAGFTPKVRHESDLGATLLGLVSKGLGVSLMPYSYSYHSPAGVKFIKVAPTSSLYAVWREDDDNAVLKNFLKIVEEWK
jgi:DNA-binding transcriptional LysR family regulator